MAWVIGQRPNGAIKYSWWMTNEAGQQWMMATDPPEGRAVRYRSEQDAQRKIDELNVAYPSSVMKLFTREVA